MMNWFTKPRTEPDAGPSDVELIRTKIAAYDAEIAEAEDELRRVSLASALGDDPEAGIAAVTKLNELRTRKNLLSDALRAAQELERENAGRLGEREFVARKRSLAQKIGQLTRDATALTQAQAATRDAYRGMVTTARSIFALLPEPLRTESAGFERRLSPAALRNLAEVEATRLSDGGLASPGTRSGMVSCRDESGNLPSLAETMAALCDNLRAGFDRCGPVGVNGSERREPEVTI